MPEQDTPAAAVSIPAGLAHYGRIRPEGRSLSLYGDGGLPDDPKLTVGECYFPPALLENPGKDTIAYYHWVVEGLRIATEHKEDAPKQQALQELLTLAENPNLSFLKEE